MDLGVVHEHLGGAFALGKSVFIEAGAIVFGFQIRFQTQFR